MIKTLLITSLMLGIGYANDCSDYKSKAIKYEKMGISSSNLDLGAKYLKMAITNKKSAMDSCFYSGFDKEKIDKDIKDMEEMRKDMINEASEKRKYEMDIAKENSDITIHHR